MNWLRTILAALAVFGVTAPVASAASTSPIFSAQCSLSHRAPDDPIVFPGQPGAAHSHDFTGNWTTGFDSTYEAMLRAAQLNPGTTCDPSADTAAYWVPTLYDPDGNPVRPEATSAYYVPGKYGAAHLGEIRPFPAGLKIIADMGKSGAYGSGWHCGDATPPAKGGTLSTTTISDCDNRDDGPGGIYPDVTHVQAKLVFPDCWDGKNLDSQNHRSHMAYSGSGGCPSTHPVSVPRLNLKVRYDTFGGQGFAISSGDPATMHADFFNAWNQAELERRVRQCLNKPTKTDQLPCTNPHEANSRDNPSSPQPHTLTRASRSCRGVSQTRARRGSRAADPQCRLRSGRVRVCAEELGVFAKPSRKHLGKLVEGQSIKVRRYSASGKYAYGSAYGDVNKTGWVLSSGLCRR